MSETETKLNCFDIAAYFLSRIDDDAGDLISNLKLQKLVYYAQGFYLALFNKPLFSEKIEAWTHGAVVPDLYHEYKKFGSNPIPSPEELEISKYDTEVSQLLDEIYDVYGQFSAWKLRDMVHDEPPYKNTLDKCQTVIEHKEMQEYFSTQINT